MCLPSQTDTHNDSFSTVYQLFWNIFFVWHIILQQSPVLYWSPELYSNENLK